MKAPQSYETYCPNCRVSHPPGTRKCLHCGGGVLPERPADSMGLRRPAEAELLAEVHDLSGPAPEPGELGEVDGETTRKPAGAARVVLSLVWIAVAVAISVYRGCQAGG